MVDQLISIIIPVYNLEAYIERAAKSVLMQSYSNIEVIIVDDGSSDGSWELINRIANDDHRVKPVQQENKGVTSARLNGIKHAAGQWIGFVDGDDEIEEDMYQRLFDNAVKYHADISHCGYQMRFEDGRIHYFYNSGLLMHQNTQKGLQELLEGTVIEPGLCNKLFARQLFDDLLDNNRVPLEIKNNEDLLMNYYLFRQAKKAVFEDWCPYHYIVRSESASRKELSYHRIHDPIAVKEIILKECSAENKMDAEKALVKTAVYTFECLILKKKYTADRKHIRRIIGDHRGAIKQLPQKVAFSAKMIYYCPLLFSVLYYVYSNKIQEKKYE